MYRRVKTLQVFITIKYVRKSLARKYGNENIIWSWNDSGAVEIHVNPPFIHLIKGKNETKPDKDCVKIELYRNLTSENSYLYDFKMDLFDNGDPEEFFPFMQNFQMTLGDSGALTSRAKIHYLCKLFSGEALHQPDILSVELGSMTTTYLNRIILGFGAYFFLLVSCQNKSAQSTTE